jgi:hypothetical protein
MVVQATGLCRPATCRTERGDAFSDLGALGRHRAPGYSGGRVARSTHLDNTPWARRSVRAGARGLAEVARAAGQARPGLDVGSPASGSSVAGSGQTGLLAANGSATFLAFIFKNALAANIG